MYAQQRVKGAQVHIGDVVLARVAHEDTGDRSIELLELFQCEVGEASRVGNLRREPLVDVVYSAGK